MPKTFLIVRKDNVYFKTFAEEPDLFGDTEESLNSFKENQVLFEIENQRLASSQPEIFQAAKCPESEKADEDFGALNGSQLTKKTSPDTESGSLDLARDRYIKALEHDNCVLEQLLDDLELLKSVRSQTGRLNCGAKQLELVKQKLGHFLWRQKNEQLTEAVFAADSPPLFRDNTECLRFIRHILENETNLKIDDDHQLNADLNLYLRLKLKNVLILSKLLSGLNIRYDSRPKVERCVEQFRAKLEPRTLAILVDLQKKFAVMDRKLKITLNEQNGLLRRYYEVLEEKELLKLRFFTNEMRLVARFQTEIKQLHAANVSLANKMNIAESSVKRMQSKI